MHTWEYIILSYCDITMGFEPLRTTTAPGVEEKDAQNACAFHSRVLGFEDEESRWSQALETPANVEFEHIIVILHFQFQGNSESI